MKNTDLINLSKQLKQPTGEKGIEIANMMNETNIGMTLNAIHHLQIENNQKILEIGHGNAGHLKKIFTIADNINYHGIDISELMVHEARKNNHQYIKQKKASFELYDGENIPYENQYFDAIFTVNTIYFIQNPTAFFNEIARVMKQNATFCLTFADERFMKTLPFTKYNFTLYKLEQLTKIINQTQLKIQSVDTQSEYVTSKSGNKVVRIFHTCVLIK